MNLPLLELNGFCSKLNIPPGIYEVIVSIRNKNPTVIQVPEDPVLIEKAEIN